MVEILIVQSVGCGCTRLGLGEENEWEERMKARLGDCWEKESRWRRVGLLVQLGNW